MPDGDGNIRFILQALDACNRKCKHCGLGANEDGAIVPFPKIESVISEMGEIAATSPSEDTKKVQLTGGEILLYSWEDKGLGDVVNTMFDSGLTPNLFTRGWTNAEQRYGKLPYANFEALREFREPISKDSTVTVSFDTYTANGNLRIASQMARNAILGFQDLNPKIGMKVSLSKVNVTETYREFRKFIKSLKFKPFEATWKSLKKDLKEVNGVSEQVIFYRNPWKFCYMVFRPDYSHSGILTVEFQDLEGVGNAANLPGEYFLDDTCPTIDDNSTEITIRAHDLGAVLCPSFNHTKIPPIGRLGVDSLQDIIKKIPEYRFALFQMQEEYNNNELKFKGVSVCDACPTLLAKYWP